MQPLVRLLTLALLTCSVAAIYPQLCPNQEKFSSWNQTRCPADMTCAPNSFSVTGWGCAPFANATICSQYQTCPSDTTCVSMGGTSYSEVFACMGKNGAPNTTSLCTCKPGVALPMDSTRKNVVIVGDSLTIGYTPVVAGLLADVALVQHVPWSADGGAEETAYGLQCIDLWLASPSGMPISPDLIYFNFGRHDFTTSCTPGHGCTPGQSGNTTVYPGELKAIGEKIQAFASRNMPAKVLFGITSPFMCDAEIDSVILGTLNAAAVSVMQSLGIPTVDLHKPIIDVCGPPPNSHCMNVSQCFCPHCPGVGYEYVAKTTVAPAIRNLLMQN